MGAESRDLKLTYANIEWLTDWLTHWHMMLGCWMSVARPFALCRKRCRWPNKMKVKNCVHVNTSHISVMPRNRTTNRLAPPVSTSFSLSPSRLVWLLQLALPCISDILLIEQATGRGNRLWQLATGERQQWRTQCIHAASPEMQIFNNISFFSSLPCCQCVFYLFSLGFTNTEYSNLKLTSCMWTEHSTNIGLLFKYTWRVPVPLFVFVFVAFSYSQAYPVCSTHSIEYMIEYECTPDPQTERLTHKTTDW